MGNVLTDRLARGPLLLDGGVGTLLQGMGASADGSVELLNLTDPDRVRQVYKRYLEAGSQVLTTNSYNGSSRGLEHFGASGKAREVNRASVRLAREMRELQGEYVLVTGSVGPLTGYLQSTGMGYLAMETARSLFREQVSALVEGGADMITLETFSDLGEILLALQVVRGVCDLPIIAMMTFDDDSRTAFGTTAAQAAVALHGAGATAIGANCGSGPRGVLKAVREMVTAAPDALVVAKPNAGWPHRAQNRLFFATTPEYAANFALEAVAAGARLVGGCCGMGPEHIAAMNTALRQLDVVRQEAATVEAPRQARPTPAPDDGARSVDVVTSPAPRKSPAGKQTHLQARLAAGEFVISVEMHPPRTHLTGAFLRAAREYKEAGVELVNVVDSPMARVRMSSTLACALVQERTGLETITHVTPRDRTLLGLQSELMGAHALGVRNILCVTGDPHQPNLAPGTVNVYDIDSVGLIRLLAGYNRGLDPKGNDIGQPAHFCIGGALNPNAPDLGLEVERFHQKLEAGMQFAMVQPVFDVAILARLLERLGRPPVPVIAGVCPIHSYQHALLLHNEIPGIRLTEPVLARMRQAASSGEQEGLAIARELLAAARDCCQGVYIMPSYGRHETALKVLQG